MPPGGNGPRLPTSELNRGFFHGTVLACVGSAEPHPFFRLSPARRALQLQVATPSDPTSLCPRTNSKFQIDFRPEEQPIMSARAGFPLSNRQPDCTSKPSMKARLSALRSRLSAWVETCVTYSQAAALYDQLSRLSDAELHRRGFSRATLARKVCDTCPPRLR
jgi:hypothetical protein